MAECFCDLSVEVDRLSDAAWVVECPKCGKRYDAMTDILTVGFADTLIRHSFQPHDHPTQELDPE